MEAFDLAADSGELHPLPASEADAGRCSAELERWTKLAEDARKRLADRPRTRWTPEVVQRLRSLGYLQ
jgi:hypothetical protein